MVRGPSSIRGGRRGSVPPHPKGGVMIGGEPLGYGYSPDGERFRKAPGAVTWLGKRGAGVERRRICHPLSRGMPF